ncbi:hypothetical protein BXZ70DRAFT_908978 [Cristinia sonorae]|uniref:Uncharacterized protein n=1 Tax=Cristinia sonorae TaxID=1940300 RepID=A0A8K0UL59_9AGAR|nr:hypothetical protein BXZ70DRAFT_908978 [Cristinia sonorae]
MEGSPPSPCRELRGKVWRRTNNIACVGTKATAKKDHGAVDPAPAVKKASKPVKKSGDSLHEMSESRISSNTPTYPTPFVTTVAQFEPAVLFKPTVLFGSSFKDLRCSLFRQVHVEVMSGGKFADFNLPLYTRRTRGGISYEPRTLGINKTLLAAASPVFTEVIFENAEVHNDGYAGDSDLDDDVDDEDSESGRNHLSSSPSSSESASSHVRIRPPITVRTSIDIVEISDDEDQDSEYIAHRTGVLPKGSHGVSEKTSTVRDGAFKTWQSMVLFLYDFDDHIVFNPLRSCSNSNVMRNVAAEEDSFGCSPKSMYRLAAKFELQELKTLAEKSLKAQLTADNIVSELFCDFTWRYPEVLQMEIQVFNEHYQNLAVQNGMAQVFDKISKGELPHSSIVLRSLFTSILDRNTSVHSFAPV